MKQDEVLYFVDWNEQQHRKIPKLPPTRSCLLSNFDRNHEVIAAATQTRARQAEFATTLRNLGKKDLVRLGESSFHEQVPVEILPAGKERARTSHNLRHIDGKLVFCCTCI